MVEDVVIRGEQEACGARGRVADGLPRSGLLSINDSLDEGTRSEVLASSRFRVLRVLPEEPFVDSTLDIDAEVGPRFGIDKLHEAAELRGVGYLVLSLAEDVRDEAGTGTEAG